MDFNVAISRILGHEGGYVNDPIDPGGETNWGISKRSYPNVDIKNLTKKEAIEIYRTDFWNAIHAYEMYDGVAYQALDFAVNSGIQTAIRKLQKAVGVADDGYWGPVTRAKVASMQESDILMLLIAERIEYMVSLSTFKHHGAGWMNRMAVNLRYAAQDS